MQTNADKSTTVTNVPPLNQLYIYLTEGCNLKCSHCWLAPKFDADGTRHPTLPIELFEQAIQEAKPLGLQGVKLTGGEPLLHPRIVDLLRIIRREALELTIESNGLLCTPQIAAEISKTSQSFVSISIDGVNAETHDAIRGIPGSFAQACQGIRNLVECRVSPQIIMSLMRSNVDQVSDMIGMAEELGASSVKFNIIQPTGRGEQIRDDRRGLSIAELIELGHYVDTDLASNSPVPLFFDYPAAFRPLSRIADGDSSTCGILGILGVLASGRYALCGIGEHVPELVFGHIGVDALETLWQDNEILKDLRSGLPHRLSGICARCLMKSSCFASCLAQNYYRSQDLWGPFWFCEQAEELGVFPKSRLMNEAIVSS